jgi:hypothetical protein
MSYQRSPYPLTYFKTGETQYYVFYHCDGYMQDYGTSYDDDKSFIELLIDIMKQEIPDKHYILKMLHTLSKKLNVESHLKSDEEILKELSYLDGVKRRYD